MRPESTNGTGGGGLAVPMAWLCAEYLADELMRVGDLVEPGSLEYRAGRRTLALTIYLCDGTDGLAGAGGGVPAGTVNGSGTEAMLDEWLIRTSCGHPWRDWVRAGLAARRERAGGNGEPDLDLALETWRVLESTELLATELATDLDVRPPATAADVTVDESARVWLPAWHLGLPLGHLALRLF
ncbi:hypothetical protein [Streptomyces sp. SP18CS02]|uniref:hypothetical protein n=1 Tax=Streptomyces sp. SP18CS02 TaxID=3002531 RepID=UPI002E763FE2|nr:hypothetical protein [Streptomyces sp. SP18CS02]MEE1754515.1 hypothetical protein [Streptomyces sp. SP18CS02]